jgi:hypothetical protein
MSGGSYGYVYARFEEAARGLRERHGESHVVALAAHLADNPKLLLPRKEKPSSA